jgi:hypothetical protein
MSRALFGKSRSFTQSQAASVFAANLILWGAEGNGLHEVANALWGDEKDMSPELRLAVSQGAVASLLSVLSGGDVKVATGTRFGTFNWYRDLIKDIGNGEFTIPDLALGVTKKNYEKFTGITGNIALLWKSNEVSGEVFLETLRQMGTIFSSFSNATKVWLMLHNEGRIYSKRGDLITIASESEAWYKLFGIDPAEIHDYYEGLDMLKADAQAVKEVSDAARQAQLAAMMAMARGDFVTAEKYKNIVYILATEDPRTSAKVFASVKKMAIGTPLAPEVVDKLYDREIDYLTSTYENTGE